MQRGVWGGWAISMSVTGLYQDWMGQEAIIASARDHWMPASRSVPLLVAVLLCVSVYLGVTAAQAGPPEIDD